MIPMPYTNNEAQRQQAFRSLAVARKLSLAQAPNAGDAYDHAQELAQQALDDSRSPLEDQMADQLMMIVADDHQRHQRVADTREFPAAVDM